MGKRSCLTVLLAWLVACSENSTSPTLKPGAPAALQLVSGDQQLDTVGRELAQPLVVRVMDSAGHRVPGQIVNFRVVAGGGSVFGGAAITNDSGEARERWTLGTVAGDTQRVEARAVDAQTGLALVFGVFRATGLPDAPTTITKVEGDGQSGVSGSTLAESLSVRVTDQYGNTVPGTMVTWTVSSGGGSVSPGSNGSNAAGVAKTEWTLGPAVGIQSVTAGISGHAPITFTATTTAPSTPTVVTIVSGNNQIGVAGAVLAESLVVRVTDQNGINVVGVTVTWTVTGGGGSISPTVGLTDAAGLSKAQWTLGSASGTHTAAGTVSGIAPAVFRATTPNFALDFNQSWAAVPDNSALGVRYHWTIETWLFPRNVSSGRQHLISKWDGGGNASYAMVIDNGGKLSLEVHDGINPTDFVYSKATLANAQWQHVAVTFDSGTARLYINGSLDTTVTGLVIPMISNRPLSFGHEGPPYNGWLYNGLLDEIRVWNVTRTGGEIAANMSVVVPGATSGLIGYWRFNEGSGDVAVDGTGHGHNAQLGNVVGADANDPLWTTNAAPVP